MNLRELRLTAGLTQQSLADALMVRQSAVANWEKGLSKPLRKYWTRMALELRCTVETLEQALEETVSA